MQETSFPWACSSKAFTLSGKILQLTKISMEQAVLGRRKTEARPQNIEKTREVGAGVNNHLYKWVGLVSVGPRSHGYSP